MIAIKTVDLTKKYKSATAVDKLNLEVDKGELFALLGVNGAGKTTLLKMLCCLLKPTSGDAFLEGQSVVSQTGKVKDIIALSPQETSIAPKLSVKENLVLMGGVCGFSRVQAQQRADELSKKFGLDVVKGKAAGTLSGGWQRKLSLAMALMTEPKILFLDEPTLGLDVLARREFWHTINSLKGKMTILLTTHYLQEAEALADRVGIMKDGRLLACGTAEQITGITGAQNFEDAFVDIVKEETK